MKKIILRSVIAAFLLLSLWAVPAKEKASASSFHTEVRESVAVVAEYLEYKEYNYGGIYAYGTGFFIGKEGEDPEYMITNHHVVEDFLENGNGQYINVVVDGVETLAKVKLRVYFDENDYVEAYVEDYNATKDIALLRLESPTDKRKPIALCSPTEDMIGSTIYCVGFPGSADNFYVDTISSWGKEDATVTTGTISRFLTTSGTGVKSIQTDAVIQHGNSGGPMVNGNGSVIGINTYSVDSDDGESHNYAVSIDEAISMLNNNNVPYYMEKTSGSLLENKPLLIGIAAGVLVIIVIIILVVVMSGKKKSEAPQPAAAPVQPLQAADISVPPVQTRRGMVRSLSPQHNGQSFDVDRNGILIGRDRANCRIAYNEGTPGVSSRHCSITFDEASGEFLLTDLRSTYGTFLMNGQKLEPNVPYHLRAGESFYVGENSNVLKVEVV
jgi:hypothetical protein